MTIATATFQVDLEVLTVRLRWKVIFSTGSSMVSRKGYMIGCFPPTESEA